MRHPFKHLQRVLWRDIPFQTFITWVTHYTNHSQLALQMKTIHRCFPLSAHNVYTVKLLWQPFCSYLTIISGRQFLSRASKNKEYSWHKSLMTSHSNFPSSSIEKAYDTARVIICCFYHVDPLFKPPRPMKLTKRLSTKDKASIALAARSMVTTAVSVTILSNWDNSEQFWIHLKSLANTIT